MKKILNLIFNWIFQPRKHSRKHYTSIAEWERIEGIKPRNEKRRTYYDG